MQKGFSIIWIILVLVGILILVVVAVGSYYFGKMKGVYDLETSLGSIPKPSTSTPIPSETANWKTYTDNTFGFSFKYPANWKIDQIPNNTSGRDINFFKEGEKKVPTTNMHTKGNEVFRIMTYGDESIFENLKSSVVPAPQAITVNGKPALKMDGQVDILVNKKVVHLEITTDESKSYIEQILSTFKFTSS